MHDFDNETDGNGQQAEGTKGVGEWMKLPKEAIGALFGQADKTKTEVIAAVAREMRGFLNSLALEDILRKSLSGMKLKINAEIELTSGGNVSKKHFNSRPILHKRPGSKAKKE